MQSEFSAGPFDQNVNCAIEVFDAHLQCMIRTDPNDDIFRVHMAPKTLCPPESGGIEAGSTASDRPLTVTTIKCQYSILGDIECPFIVNKEDCRNIYFQVLSSYHLTSARRDRLYR